jgi:hypothetical protein
MIPSSKIASQFANSALSEANLISNSKSHGAGGQHLAAMQIYQLMHYPPRLDPLRKNAMVLLIYLRPETIAKANLWKTCKN